MRGGILCIWHHCMLWTSLEIGCDVWYTATFFGTEVLDSPVVFRGSTPCIWTWWIFFFSFFPLANSFGLDPTSIYYFLAHFLVTLWPSSHPCYCTLSQIQITCILHIQGPNLIQNLQLCKKSDVVYGMQPVSLEQKYQTRCWCFGVHLPPFEFGSPYVFCLFFFLRLRL